MIAEAKTWTEYRVTLRPDHDPESPREWDNMGTMVCFHSRYNLGDEKPKHGVEGWLDGLIYDLVEPDDPELIPVDHKRAILDKHTVMLPLYLYDHSGITMSTGAFSCPWDSGQVGYIYCTLEQARENWMRPDATWDTMLPQNNGPDITMREYAKLVLEGEVETYDQFISGQVYGFEVETREVEINLFGDEVAGEWEDGDSCWGFYGRDVEKNGMIDHAPDDERARQAFRDAEVDYD